MGLIGTVALIILLIPSTITAYPSATMQTPTEEPFLKSNWIKEVKKPVSINIDLMAEISRYSWDSSIAYKIMLCESSGNPNSHNFNHTTKDNSVGLFQINLYGALAKERPSADWLKIPANNISYAFKLYQSGGWNHWKNCL